MGDDGPAAEAVRCVPLKEVIQCEGCGGAGLPGTALRRCTRQVLCSLCRSAPEHKVVTRSRVLSKTGIDQETLQSKLIPVGSAPNPTNPGFARVKLYWWKDVMALALARGLEVDDDF